MFDISWAEALIIVVGLIVTCIMVCTRLSYKHEIDKIKCNAR